MRMSQRELHMYKIPKIMIISVENFFRDLFQNPERCAKDWNQAPSSSYVNIDKWKIAFEKKRLPQDQGDFKKALVLLYP